MSLELATQTLVNLSILLLIGITLTIIANKIKISNIFLLILSGMFLSYANMVGWIHIEFSDVLLVSLALITLVMVVLEGSSRFTVRRIEQYSMSSLKMMLTFMFFAIAFLAIIASQLFFEKLTTTTFLFSAILAVTLVGTDPSSVFKMLKNSGNKVVQILELEAIFNTPFTIILPFIFLNILTSVDQSVGQIIVGQIGPLILRITEGIGMGVLIGYFVAKIFKKFYIKDLSPLLLLTAALIAYIGSESLGGSGVLTVATMGVFLGNMLAEKQEEEYQQFSGLLSNLFIMIVFILTGLLINVDLNLMFVGKVVLLYFITLIVRFVSVHLSLAKEKFNFKEKIFLTLTIPKGVAVAVVVLSLVVLNLSVQNTIYLETTIKAIVLSMVLSLLIATIVVPFSHKLLTNPNVVPIKKKTKKKR